MIEGSDGIIRNVARLANRGRRLMDEALIGSECSGTEARILDFMLSKDGNLFQKDIEEEFIISPSTASEILRNMEKKDLIERRTMEDDARFKRIVITEKAEVLGITVERIISSLDEDITKGIPDRQLKTFCQVLERMAANLQEMNEPDLIADSHK